MPRPEKLTKPKSPPKFYGIGEWFGADIGSMSANDRRLNAALALSKKVKQRPCPFRPGRQCNKAGGVCSVRQYERPVGAEAIRLGEVVTTCPARFFDASEVFRWVGEVMLGTQTPRVIGEIPFLQKLKAEFLQEGDQEPGEGDFIGRIDNILVHPDTSAGLKWCALELQAVYFSGASRYELDGGRFRLRPKRCVFAKLDSTIKALTGGTPLPQEIFEGQIRAKLVSDF